MLRGSQFKTAPKCFTLIHIVPVTLLSSEPVINVMTEALETAIPIAEEFVKRELAGNDGSHDFFHIDRVRNTAISLSREEVRKVYMV